MELVIVFCLIASAGPAHGIYKDAKAAGYSSLVSLAASFITHVLMTIVSSCMMLAAFYAAKAVAAWMLNLLF